MKVVRKILYVIAGLIVLLTILIVVCAYNPGVTTKIQSLIFRGRSVEVKDIVKSEGADSGDDSVSENIAAEEPYRMRSLGELGISEDSLIKDMNSYYENCKAQIIEHGAGDYSFENVIAGEALVQQIYANYSNKDYVNGYMDEALKEIGGYSYNMNLLVEELEGKNFRLTHQVTIN